MRPFPIVVLLAGILLVGCGGHDDRSENAARFEEKVGAIDYKVELEPNSESHPGLVIGKATTRDGVSSNFALSFGPAPEKLPPKLQRDGAVWVEAGDEVNYWIEDFPAHLSTAQGNRVVNLRFAIEDIACRVVAGKACRY